MVLSRTGLRGQPRATLYNRIGVCCERLCYLMTEVFGSRIESSLGAQPGHWDADGHPFSGTASSNSPQLRRRMG